MNHKANLREIAERHYKPDTRHIGRDDYLQMLDAANHIQQMERELGALTDAILTIHRVVEEA